jgi:hypothetical protein
MEYDKMLKAEDILEWNLFIKNVAPLGKRFSFDYVSPPSYRLPQKTQLDLHGLTVNDAHRSVMDFVDGHSGKYIMVITGLSGQIKKEFKRWFANHKTVSRAYKLFFKKKRLKKL